MQSDGNSEVDWSGAELSTDTQVFAMYESELALHSGTDLLRWVTDNYGGVLSYTEARVANKFDLKLEDHAVEEAGEETYTCLM